MEEQHSSFCEQPVTGLCGSSSELSHFNGARRLWTAVNSVCNGFLSSPPLSKGNEVCIHLKIGDQNRFLQLETVNYFCAFWPFSWLSPFQKGSFVCCPCSVHGWHLAGLFFLGTGTSASPWAALCLLLGDRPTLRLSAGSREMVVWKYRAGQQHLAPRSQKERWEEGAQQVFALCLDRQGPRPWAGWDRPSCLPSPLPHWKRHFWAVSQASGTVTVFGKTSQKYPMRWHDPSLVGELIPGIHKQPWEHSPGRERFSLLTGHI